MDFEDSLQEANYKLQLKADFKWKEEQLKCLKAVYDQNDILAVLPTGFGKSFIFQATPFILSAKNGVDVDSDLFEHVVFVITPLNSIMMDQCKNLSRKEIKACYLDYVCEKGIMFGEEDFEEDASSPQDSMTCNVELGDIAKGMYSIVYAHPESLLSSRGKRLLRSMRKRIGALAIDEAHIILEWGENFRKDFDRIGQDLLPLIPGVPIMLFTATAPPAARRNILKSLNMENPTTVDVNPNRKNITYVKIFRPPSMQTKDHLEDVLRKILSDLMLERENYPQTLVYTDTDCIAYCYWFAERTVGDAMYIGEHCPENRIFGQYHSEYTQKMKEHIVSELCKEESKLRLVFATVALGMGLDAPHVRHVIHYKPPTSIEKYFQETGRAGRDGRQATATMYFNNTDIRKNRPGISEEMISYCKNDDKCLRSSMLEYFGYKAPEHRDKNKCCSICNPKLLD